MRSIRRLTQLFFTLLGAAIVGYAVIQVEPLNQRIAVTVFGLFVMEIGIWQITRAFFPNEREFRPLRTETDYFLKLVRRLNRAAVSAEAGSAAGRQQIDELHADMIHSVERMRRLAGRTEEELGLAAVSKPAAGLRKLIAH